MTLSHARPPTRARLVTNVNLVGMLEYDARAISLQQAIHLFEVYNTRVCGKSQLTTAILA